MKNFIYITFAQLEYERYWTILCDDGGKPFTNIDDAYIYAIQKYKGLYWGITEHGQMMVNNAQMDNF